MSENKYNDNLPPPPKHEDFKSEDEYLEAKGYYGSHVGRIRKMVEQARAHQAERLKSESQVESKRESTHDATQEHTDTPKQMDMNSQEYHDHMKPILAQVLLREPELRKQKAGSINNKAVATWLKKKARPKQGWSFVPMDRLLKLRKINVRNMFFSRMALPAGYLKNRRHRCLYPLLQWYPPNA